MKHNIIVISFFFLNFSFINAQEQDVEKLSDSIIKIVQAKLGDEYEINEKELLGTFILKKKKIDVGLEEEESFFKGNSQATFNSKLEISNVKIDIREGVIFDLRVNGELDSKDVIFTNRKPINISSINNYRIILQYRRRGVDDDKQKIYSILLRDFLEYDYENGQNYIIEKELVELIAGSKEKEKIYGGTTLKSLIDFRIYSDFLGLVNESPNGIVNFEGNSTFFLNPFSIGGYNYMFKKLTTSIGYSRFDDNDREVELLELDTLNLIQKSFLKVSGELDLFETRFSKRYPYKLSLKTKASLDLAEVSRDSTETTNTSTLSIGLGASIQIQRYANFGLNASVFLNRYENSSLLETVTLNFNTIALNTEVYFYESKDSDNAFFLRLRYEQGTNDLSSSSNFFNFQVGYKAQLNFKPKKTD
ncbi:hypothetical protein [Croceitalea sp. P059]|uniref:hypothetical protein n=1 Tax=Croceitalea sp. P059 TaxID=3075601 RepID=UPI002884653D|nr:hypothetical protein [Croceitalea sp. P059]MDT0538863.1 hypothetical protein [Croceitalea sp. P059]